MVGLIFGPKTGQPLSDAKLIEKLFQESAILSCHCRWIERGRVLFHDQPIIVTLIPKLLEDSPKIEISLSHRGKNERFECVCQIPPPGSSLVQDLGANVFYMGMPDSRSVFR